MPVVIQAASTCELSANAEADLYYTLYMWIAHGRAYVPAFRGTKMGEALGYAASLLTKIGT